MSRSTALRDFLLVVLACLALLALIGWRQQSQEGGGYRGAELHGDSVSQPAVAAPDRAVVALPPGPVAKQPAPSAGVSVPAPTRYRASATWCAPTPTQCQDWGGNAKLGAVYGFRFGDRPYPVRVSRGGNAVVVTVVSHCACRGTDAAIDLSPSAFVELAPLSRGRIDVTVEVLDGQPDQSGEDPPVHPDDTKMRAEVRDDEIYR